MKFEVEIPDEIMKISLENYYIWNGPIESVEWLKKCIAHNKRDLEKKIKVRVLEESRQ